MQEHINISNIFTSNNLIRPTEINENTLFKIYENLEYKFCKRGDVLFEMGDESEAIYFLISGTIEVLKPNIEKPLSPKKSRSNVEGASSVSKSISHLQEQSVFTRVTRQDTFQSGLESKPQNTRKMKKTVTLRSSSIATNKESRNSCFSKLSFSKGSQAFRFQNSSNPWKSTLMVNGSTEKLQEDLQRMAFADSTVEVQENQFLISSMVDQRLLEYKKEKLNKKKHMKIFKKRSSEEILKQQNLRLNKMSFYSGQKKPSEGKSNRFSLSTKKNLGFLKERRFRNSMMPTTRSPRKKKSEFKVSNSPILEHDPGAKKFSLYNVKTNNATRQTTKTSFFMMKSRNTNFTRPSEFNFSSNILYSETDHSERMSKKSTRPFLARVNNKSGQAQKIHSKRSMHVRLNSSNFFARNAKLVKSRTKTNSRIIGLASIQRFGTEKKSILETSPVPPNVTNHSPIRNMSFLRLKRPNPLTTIESTENENLIHSEMNSFLNSKEYSKNIFQADKLQKPKKTKKPWKKKLVKKKTLHTKRKTTQQIDMIMKVYDKNSFRDSVRLSSKSYSQSRQASQNNLNKTEISNYIKDYTARSKSKAQDILDPGQVHPNFRKNLKKEGDLIVKQTILDSRKNKKKNNLKKLSLKRKSKHDAKNMTTYKGKKYVMIAQLSGKRMIGETGVIFNKTRNSSIGCQSDCQFAIILKKWIKEIIGTRF